MTRHTIAGIPADATKTGPQVLAHALAFTELHRAFKRDNPTYPSIYRRIKDGSTRYAYEVGEDAYQLPGQGQQVPLEFWRQYREQTAREAVKRPQELRVRGPQTILIDCEDAMGEAIAQAEMDWAGSIGFPLIQEFRRGWRVTGWHALAVIEVPIGTKLAAEVPWPKLPWYAVIPRPARPGWRYAVIDVAWLAGMPRHDRPARSVL